MFPHKCLSNIALEKLHSVVLIHVMVTYSYICSKFPQSSTKEPSALCKSFWHLKSYSVYQNIGICPNWFFHRLKRGRRRIWPTRTFPDDFLMLESKTQHFSFLSFSLYHPGDYDIICHIIFEYVSEHLNEKPTEK